MGTSAKGCILPRRFFALGLAIIPSEVVARQSGFPSSANPRSRSHAGTIAAAFLLSAISKAVTEVGASKHFTLQL